MLGLYWDVAEGVYAVGLIEGMFDDYCRLLAALANNEACWNETEPASVIESLRKG